MIMMFILDLFILQYIIYETILFVMNRHGVGVCSDQLCSKQTGLICVSCGHAHCSS